MVFRQKLKLQEALGKGAYDSDRPMSWLVAALIKDAPGVDASAQAHRDNRGTPSEDSAITINQVVEIPGEHGGVRSKLVGEYCDQEYYLMPAEIERLEALAAEAQLSPDQTIDWLIATRLQTVVHPVP